MNFKRLLIIDDSEIDREVLKNILCSDFEIIESDNGYSGLELILRGKPRLDAVLLDISMPVLDGFNVLQLMNENKIKNLPVILITAEATMENVQKAVQYNISEFISKPFDAETILTRLRTLLDVQAQENTEVIVPGNILTENDIAETDTYISKLGGIYKTYLKNTNRNDEDCIRVSAIMKLLLEEYAAAEKNTELDSAHITMISKAAYFYDIGKMTLPDELLDGISSDETDKRTFESHTITGADIIWLNHSPSCRYFVQTCADMCMHHHERFDGKGFPHQLKYDDIPFYTQLCSLSSKFDRIFSKRPSFSETQFDFVLNEMAVDAGEFSPDLLDLLRNCRSSILSYYKKQNRTLNRI